VQKVWEGEASAEPLTPNKFGAQKVRHQPLAEASDMNAWFNDAIKGKPCYGLQSVVDDETKFIHATGFNP